MAALLGALQAAGVTLAATGGALWATPGERLTEAHRAAIGKHKPAILAVVTLRQAVTGGACWREIRRLHRAARVACFPDVVTIRGDVIPRRVDAGEIYRQAQREAEGQRLAA